MNLKLMLQIYACSNIRNFCKKNYESKTNIVIKFYEKLNEFAEIQNVHIIHAQIEV